MRLLGRVLLGAVLLTLPACTDDDPPPGATVAAGTPTTLADNPHMDGATRLLGEAGTGPGTFALPDVSGHPTLLLTVACPSDDTDVRLDLQEAPGTPGPLMRSEGCNGYSFETPPLDPAHLPTSLRVEVDPGAAYAVYVYGTAPAVSG